MTRDLTERALASLLKDVGYSTQQDEELTDAQKARIKESKMADLLAMGEENYFLEAALRRKTKARTGGATADTATEQFEDIQKFVQDRADRRGIMYQPPKFTRGAPTAAPTAQQHMMQVVGNMLQELQKNIELPTEESTDA